MHAACPCRADQAPQEHEHRAPSNSGLAGSFGPGTPPVRYMHWQSALFPYAPALRHGAALHPLPLPCSTLHQPPNSRPAAAPAPLLRPLSWRLRHHAAPARPPPPPMRPPSPIGTCLPPHLHHLLLGGRAARACSREVQRRPAARGASLAAAAPADAALPGGELDFHVLHHVLRHGQGGHGYARAACCSAGGRRLRPAPPSADGGALLWLRLRRPSTWAQSRGPRWDGSWHGMGRGEEGPFRVPIRLRLMHACMHACKRKCAFPPYPLWANSSKLLQASAPLQPPSGRPPTLPARRTPIATTQGARPNVQRSPARRHLPSPLPPPRDRPGRAVSPPCGLITHVLQRTHAP